MPYCEVLERNGKCKSPEQPVEDATSIAKIHTKLFPDIKEKKVLRDKSTGVPKGNVSDQFNSSLKGSGLNKPNTLKKVAGVFSSEIKNKLEDLQKWLLSTVLDPRHLLQIKEEMDANFSRGVKGVLVARLYGVIPDPAGSYREYLGLQIVGEGESEELALRKYQEIFNQSQKSLDSSGQVKRKLDGVCTPSNPLGESTKKIRHAEIKAAPDGMNIGYKQQLSSKIERFYQINPNNISDVKIGDISLLRTKYIEREFRFISVKEWKEFKDAMEKNNP